MEDEDEYAIIEEILYFAILGFICYLAGGILIAIGVVVTCLGAGKYLAHQRRQISNEEQEQKKIELTKKKQKALDQKNERLRQKREKEKQEATEIERELAAVEEVRNAAIREKSQKELSTHIENITDALRLLRKDSSNLVMLNIVSSELLKITQNQYIDREMIDEKDNNDEINAIIHMYKSANIDDKQIELRLSKAFGV